LVGGRACFGSAVISGPRRVRGTLSSPTESLVPGVQTMHVSVLVPTYNRANYIGATLTSLLGQSHKPDEIVVVDDGSTDNTADVVAAFDHSSIRYIRSTNGGPTAARQKALENASCDWIAFCDSDDLWEVDKLALHARLIDLREVQLSFSNFRVVQENVWEERTKFQDAPAGYWDGVHQIEDGLAVFDGPFYPRLLQFNPMFPSTMVLHRRWIERFGALDVNLSRLQTEDFEFSLRYTQAGPLGIVTKPVVGIRKHGDNFSGGSTYGFVWSDVQILEHSLRKHVLASQYEDTIREQVRVRSAHVAAEAFSDGDYLRCREAFKRVPWSARDFRLMVKGTLSLLPDNVLDQLREARNRLRRNAG
jgi:glycosyltransferase involved in cell wall biosynthesis